MDLYNTIISDPIQSYKNDNKVLTLKGFEKPRLNARQQVRVGAGFVPMLMFTFSVDISPVGRFMNSGGILQEEQKTNIMTGEPIDRSFLGRVSSAGELASFGSLFSLGYNTFESIINANSDNYVERETGQSTGKIFKNGMQIGNTLKDYKIPSNKFEYLKVSGQILFKLYNITNEAKNIYDVNTNTDESCTDDDCN